MGWLEIKNQDDITRLMETVEEFHDWYVAGYSYDPLAHSETNDLNLGRFKVDVDALNIIFRWDCRTKRGIWPEVELEFSHIDVFRFTNFRDPDPLSGCAIKRAGEGWLFVDEEALPLSDNELLHPENIKANLLISCGKIRWRPLAVVSADDPNWFNSEPPTQEEIAKQIAIKAHAGQVDKAGKPYLNHPAAVAAGVDGDKTKALAWLHDVVEDTDITFEELAEAGIDEEIISALRLLTHEGGVPYMEYVAALKSNELARAVKLSDLRHNSDLSRLETVTDKDLRRREKYLQAIEFLES